MGFFSMFKNSLDLIKYLDLDRYKIKKLLGKGAFGEVYLCFDQELRRNVAVKIFFSTAESSSEIDIYDLARESILLAKVEHENIVPIYDIVKQESSVMMVMRYINGLSLQTVLKQHKAPIPIKEAYIIFRKILLAIDFSHSRGVIHLDLKPDNVLLSMANEVFISDFGISQHIHDVQSGKNDKLGTPLYMSPEQISGSFIDPRSDIYSLGLLYYRMITGVHPFEYCQSIDHLIECHHESMPVKPSYYEESIPEELDDIIFKAIQKKPSERYRSCLELMQALDNALGFQILSESRKQDFRYFVRINISTPVLCSSSSNKEEFEGEMVDLSVGGCSIIFNEKLNLAGEVKIKFSLNYHNNKIDFYVKAILIDYQAYNKKWTHLRVQFINLSDEEKNIIATFVRNSLLDEESSEKEKNSFATDETIKLFQ
ncbi:MAG TPA: hypothetical protein EYQ42_02725 [Thiotrichaceae bacterium]|jgi:serine/threonine protein kinase|nr:hypothetical protein [Thiotrichaceae bacterium]HIM06999.1 hypothetical protein [Gammaproteobacteria bacterium]